MTAYTIGQTFTGMQYLQIDIASNYGLDKLDFQDRINWVVENEERLEDLLNQAETPALYFAGVQAYRQAQQGQPIGYPISLDAASSGLQLLACLIGCEASAKLCGVVPTGHREDAYMTIYKAMLDVINGGTLAEQPGDSTPIAGGITRADVKKAINH